MVACRHSQQLALPARPAQAITGSAFYTQVIPISREERETLAVHELLSGNLPAFLRKLTPIKTEWRDTTGQLHAAVYYVTPDYLAIGNSNDFARLPLTPMAAQRIADSLQCFLPTRKMVDDIYRHCAVQLEPVPLLAYRDSALSFWHHHLIIEGQRQGRKGPIGGIKKDVVISGKVPRDPKPHRVAIYGWHLLNGKAIQPLYTGHVDWYVDYSHGIRLVYRKIRVDGRWMDYRDVLANPLLQGLLCDEAFCDFYRYE